MPETATAAREDGAPIADCSSDRRALARWLLVCCAMVFVLAVIGAITRLTESGLSIMEWALFTGILPPLSAAEWDRVFALYQRIPEYQELNAGMTLAEFREIFWWEWIHRLWGRLTGLAYLLPFVWFLLRRRIPRPLVGPLGMLVLLVVLQGALGWYMVSSGFAERTDVSQYRLAAHLGLAAVIYGYTLWLALTLGRPEPNAEANGPIRRLRAGLIGLTCLVGVTMVSGAFVAGLDAGLTYNTFPLMDGRLVPRGYGALEPWILNLFENVAAVQFNHRLLAVVTVGTALGLWTLGRTGTPVPRARRALDLVAGMALIQLGLGIATLLLAVPVWLGALHQAGALLLLGGTLHALHGTRASSPLRASASEPRGSAAAQPVR